MHMLTKDYKTQSQMQRAWLKQSVAITMHRLQLAMPREVTWYQSIKTWRLDKETNTGNVLYSMKLIVEHLFFCSNYVFSIIANKTNFIEELWL